MFSNKLHNRIKISFTYFFKMTLIVKILIFFGLINRGLLQYLRRGEWPCDRCHRQRRRRCRRRPVPWRTDDRSNITGSPRRFCRLKDPPSGSLTWRRATLTASTASSDRPPRPLLQPPSSHGKSMPPSLYQSQPAYLYLVGAHYSALATFLTSNLSQLLM